MPRHLAHDIFIQFHTQTRRLGNVYATILHVKNLGFFMSETRSVDGPL
jgi:hypothetical protein